MITKKRYCFTLSEKTMSRIEEIVKGKNNLITRQVSKSELIELLIDRLFFDKQKSLHNEYLEILRQKEQLEKKAYMIAEELDEYLKKKRESEQECELLITKKNT